MNLYLPDNLYSKLILKCIDKSKKFNVHFLPSSVLTPKILSDESSVGLVPLFDLLKNSELFVSSKFGLSFEGRLSNSYFYFNNNSKIDNLKIIGDVSSTEVLLSKIIFKEEYEIDINVEISAFAKNNDSNLLVVGDSNFIDYDLDLGLSLSEKLSDIMELQFPFVNYMLVSQEKNNLKYFDDNSEDIQNKIYDFLEGTEKFDPFKTKSLKFIKENISSLIVNFAEQDRNGLTEELKLPYYHGFVKDMVDVKFT